MHDVKDTNKFKRATWLEEIRNKFRVSKEKLRSTKEEVKRVINDVPSSASGPDAIPYEAYRKVSGLAVELFFELTNALLDGNDILGKDFNLAYMICIPKKPDGQLDDLTPYYSAG